MLTITPCLEKEPVQAFAKKCQKVYHAGMYLYQAVERGNVVATALFEITSELVQICYYEADEPDDHFLFDGVFRAGLNYAAEQGLETGLIPESFCARQSRLLAGLKYPMQEAFNITNFFQKYKNCR